MKKCETGFQFWQVVQLPVNRKDCMSYYKVPPYMSKLIDQTDGTDICSNTLSNENNRMTDRLSGYLTTYLICFT